MARALPEVGIERQGVDPDDLLGEGTFYAKVDVTLPERVQRRWEKKPEMASAA